MFPLSSRQVRYVTQKCHNPFVNRGVASTSRRTVTSVNQLDNWNIHDFRQYAFNPQVPTKLPFAENELPAACKKWFVHHKPASARLHEVRNSELQLSFWSQHSATMVPLEFTSIDTRGEVTFNRSEVPLELLVHHLNSHTGPATTTTSTRNPTPTPITNSAIRKYSIYLAQCDIASLPALIRQDLPTPDLVMRTDRGDLYSSSLWMGRPPTYTPLHRDPNPNLFLQLAGSKLVRLFPPEIGDAIFEDVQQRLAAANHGGNSSRSLRGEEMMQGAEHQLLYETVWAATGNETIISYAVEAKLTIGEALFIPKGWWHSVKGVGSGVTASANWWFR